MCNPAFLAMGTTAIGTGISAYGDMKAGKAQASYYNTLSGQNNQQAVDVTKAGVADVSGIRTQEALTLDQKQREVARVQGSQRAALAANGVTSDSGSAMDIAADTANTAARDAAAIKYNADIKAFQVGREAELKARALRVQAGQLGEAGVNAVRTGGLNATSSLINGATQVAGQWYKWNQTSKDKNNASRPSS